MSKIVIKYPFFYGIMYRTLKKSRGKNYERYRMLSVAGCEKVA